MALGDIASKLGYPVFPCTDKKQPPDKGGFHTATADAGAILAAFHRPGADMIGMPTGLPSGIVAIDVDVRPDRSGMDWLNENSDCLPQTRTHKTRSGGLHLLFRRPEGVVIRNSAGRIAPGVDVRGDGGYIIVPPSPGYALADATEPADMPTWLIKACATPEREQREYQPQDHSGSTRYGLAALEAECGAVRAAGFGQQETTLNSAGLKLGALVAGGHLIEQVARAELLHAASMFATEPGRAPWSHSELEEKVKRAINDGKRSPRGPEPSTSRALNGQKQPKTSEQPSQNNELNPGPGVDEKTPLEVVYFDDIQPKLATADFVEGLLIEAAMSVIYGQSNSGKTFFMSDLALHVAAARPWCGREIAQGAVIWVAMEGAYGISNRVTAWREEHAIGEASVPFAVIPTALNLLDPEAHTDDLIRTIKIVASKLQLPVKLVVMDTLSRAIAGGNENSPEDMGALVTNGTRIQQETGAHVAWIHHSGKDEAKGARGHSLLRAASDTEIEISADGTARTARVTKQREMECGGEFPFTLKVVEVGQNGRGKPVTSCVVVHSGQVAGATSESRTRLRGHAKRAYEILQDILAQHGETGRPGAPAGIPSVPDSWWRERFYERAMPGDDQGTKQKAFKRVSTEMLNDHIVGFNAGRIWIVRAPKEPTIVGEGNDD